VWIITEWQHMSLEVTVKGFKKCCISNATGGMLGVSVRKMKAPTLKMETVTLIYKGRWNLMWFVRCTQSKGKYFS